MRLHCAFGQPRDVADFVYRIAINQLQRYAGALGIAQSGQGLVQVDMQRFVGRARGLRADLGRGIEVGSGLVASHIVAMHIIGYAVQPC